MSLRPQSARRLASLSRAQPLLFFLLRAGSWLWCCRKSDNRGFGIRNTRTATAVSDRETRRILSFLRSDEFGEVSVGEHDTMALGGLANGDIAQIACGVMGAS